MDKGRFESVAFFALFVGVSLLLFFVFAPFIQILALAAVFAALLHPLYVKLERELKGWKSLSAFMVVGLTLIFFIVPLFFLGSQILHEAQGFFVAAQDGGNYMQTIQAEIERPVHRFFPAFVFDIAAATKDVLSFISSNLASIVSETFYVALKTFLMLLAFFFFLRDGRSLLGAVVAASPLGKEETRQILSAMYETVRSIIKGTLVVALIRLVLIGIAFYLFNIPNALLWGSMGGIIGAIPGLGTPFAFIPAIIYLYLGGNTLGAVGLALFGIAVTALIDNMLTPYFFGRGLKVPSIFVLFSILGGIIFFGPVGFILGPLVLAVFLSVFHLYTDLHS